MSVGSERKKKFEYVVKNASGMTLLWSRICLLRTDLVPNSVAQSERLHGARFKRWLKKIP